MNIAKSIKTFGGKIVAEVGSKIYVEYDLRKDMYVLKPEEVVYGRKIYTDVITNGTIVEEPDVNFFVSRAKDDMVYVKPLSEQDIIDCGFRRTAEDDENITYTMKKNEDTTIDLLYNKEDGRIKIEQHDDRYFSLYVGKCIDKFHLTQIMSDVILDEFDIGSV